MIHDPFTALDGLGRLGSAEVWYRQDMESEVAEVAREYPTPEGAIAALCNEYRFALAAVLGAGASHALVTSQVGVFRRQELINVVPAVTFFSVFIEERGPRVQLNSRGDERLKVTTSVVFRSGAVEIEQQKALRLLVSLLDMRDDVRHQPAAGGITWTAHLGRTVEP